MSMPHPTYCLSCDTLLALAPATAAGITLFAKNSDRPVDEAQPLRQFARQRHAPGSALQVQYLEIPQVEETAAMIGSQPHWLWGFEHGMNEYRVAIGNESIFTKEELPEVGLLGMDLVRLGLERGRTADEALEVIAALIEEHGQGGSGHLDNTFRYNNSFIISDPEHAWVLETSGHRWVARRAHEVDSISNQVCIADDWDRASADLEGFAREQGWDEGNGKLHFEAAYRDRDSVPGIMSEGRLRQSRALLGDTRGHVTPARMRGMLRDHYAGGPVFMGGPPDQETFYSICVHADVIGNTTASMIAQLPADRARIPVYWASMATPCTAAFLPLFIDGTLPAELGRADAEATGDSPWWRFRKLQEVCTADLPSLTPKVQAIFHPWEEEVDGAVDRIRAEAEAKRAAGDEQGVHDLLTTFMREQYDAVQALHADALSAVHTA